MEQISKHVLLRTRIVSVGHRALEREVSDGRWTHQYVFDFIYTYITYINFIQLYVCVSFISRNHRRAKKR